MSRWTYLLTEPDGNRLGELTAATSRRLTVTARSPSEASFTLPGRHPEALLPVELATDLWVYRNGVLLFRGRVGPSQDQAGAASYSAVFTAHDYRSVLGRRVLWADVQQNQVDQEAIGWALIDAAQTEVGGDCGITRGAGQATGRLRDGTWEAGKNVGEAIQQLSELGDGFDWEISPELVYRVWYPRRGVTVPFTLDYGGRVTQFSRSFSAQGYANAVRTSGTDEATPATALADGLAIRPEGRWDLQQGYPDVSRDATLQGHADGLLAERSKLAPSWTVNVAEGAWAGPDDLWLGDVTPLRVRVGRLDVDEPHRVRSLSFRLGDDGGESLGVTLDAE